MLRHGFSTLRHEFSGTRLAGVDGAEKDAVERVIDGAGIAGIWQKATHYVESSCGKNAGRPIFMDTQWTFTAESCEDARRAQEQLDLAP